ncbi:MAG: family 43 glycosylhydrolase [Bacteroidota bacterium]
MYNHTFTGKSSRSILIALCCGWLLCFCSPGGFKDQLPSPLFVDPNHHGSCDPEIVWNEATQQWYIYYTARRATVENTWLKTPIGVIVSDDLKNWTFEGYCKFDGEGGHKDEDETFWAPAIISDRGKLHMFVTYKSDTMPIQGPWGGAGAIVHYETNLNAPIEGWTKVGQMHADSLNTIDATIYKNESGFHLWFKGRVLGTKKNELYHLRSSNLYTWESEGFTDSDVFNEAKTGHNFEEAPYIFQWKNYYWLITDPHQGLLVYRSETAQDWTYVGTILKEGGKRSLDTNMARHCSVAVVQGRAFIFYHVEPWRRYDLEQKKGPERLPIFKQPTANRKSVLQVAELSYDSGRLSCNRDQVLRINEIISD